MVDVPKKQTKPNENLMSYNCKLPTFIVYRILYFTTISEAQMSKKHSHIKRIKITKTKILEQIKKKY